MISLTSLADVSGQQQEKLQQKFERKTHPENTNQVEFKISYNFYVPGKTSKIKFIINLPQTIPHRQEILKIQYAPRPKRLFRKNGNNYAEFIFIKPQKNFTIVIDVKADLFKYDLSTAKTNYKNDPNEAQNLKDFLKAEKFIEKDYSKIQAIAKTITDDSPLLTIRHIYNYVIDNLEYKGYNPHSKGVVEATQQKNGDCTEYSDLFVALCRAKNIPARVVAGYTAEFNQTPKHNWVEAYLRPYGWVPFDPIIGDVEKEPNKDDRFNNLQPIYLYFTNIRNDTTLANNYFSCWWHYGDPIKVEDSIEFK